MLILGLVVSVIGVFLGSLRNWCICVMKFLILLLVNVLLRFIIGLVCGILLRWLVGVVLMVMFGELVCMVLGNVVLIVLLWWISVLYFVLEILGVLLV